MLSSKGIVQILPLYLFDGSGKKPNISPLLLQELKNSYNKEVAVEDILFYVYATFHSNIYREKFSHLLRQDFPHVSIYQRLFDF